MKREDVGMNERMNGGREERRGEEGRGEERRGERRGEERGEERGVWMVRALYRAHVG